MHVSSISAAPSASRNSILRNRATYQRLILANKPQGGQKTPLSFWYVILGAAPLSRQRNYAKQARSEEHTSELQSRGHLVCRLLLEKKKEIELKSVQDKRTCKTRVH